MPTEKNNNEALINNLVDLLNNGNAHASLGDALKNIPFNILGERPGGLPYSIWQLAEHIRISQWDIVEFSHNAKHVSPKWPDEYWPAETKPGSKNEWQKCIQRIASDRETFIKLLKNSGDKLYMPFDWGNGQSLLKEALVLADHTSYHTGEIIILRRLLNAWKNR
jgi:hypothetical protein